MRHSLKETRVAPLAFMAMAWASLGSQAAAQDCADCPSGYTCKTFTSTICSACSGYPGQWGPDFPSADAGTAFADPGSYDAAVAYDAKDASDAGIAYDAALPPWPSDAGPAWDPGCDAGCSTYEYHTCERKECVSDSDCPSDMVCHTETWQECTYPTCERKEDCDYDASVSCTPRSQSTCTERYDLPCATDDTCGDGFECDRSPYTTCSGGGAVSFDDAGGIIFVDAGSSCTTETPDAGFCKLLELPCESDADCASGLTCQLSTEYLPCVFGAQDAAVTATDTPAVVDGGVGYPPEKGDAGSYYCPPPVTRTLCRPVRWASDAGTSGGTFGGTFGGGTFGGLLGGGLLGGGDTTGGGLPGPSDAGLSVPPESGGGPGGSTGGGAGSGPAAQDAGSASDDDDHAEHPHGRHHHLWQGFLRALGGPGGCSVAGQADGNLAWFAFMSALMFWRSRRR